MRLMMVLILCLLTGCEFCGVDTRLHKRYVCVIEGSCDDAPSRKVYSVCAPGKEEAADYVLEDMERLAEQHCTTWDFPSIDCTIYEEDKYCDI